MRLEINIPTSAKDISIKKYQKYINIINNNKDNIDFINIKALEIFCDLKLKDINQIKLTDFNSILDNINQSLNEKPKFVNKFEFNGVNYGFIPNLEEISLGEYVDLNNYLSNVDTLHKAMAVMYRPITYKHKDTYLIEDYVSADMYSDVMKEVSIDIVTGAQVFFYNLAKELLKHTNIFLTKEAKENTQLKQVLEESGDGINQFTHSLEVMLENLKISLN